MFKKSIIILFVFISAGVVTANLNRKMSAAAPASSTGGPDENHCSSAGCHDDKPVNIGSAINTIGIEDLKDQQFEPGKKYKVTVNVKDANVNRFGFQLTALHPDKSKAGVLENLDENRTQILNNYVELKDREYITYTYNSTLAQQSGETKWEFYWTAPKNSKDDVLFYLGTVSANDDGTDKGDFTYKSSLRLSPSETAGSRGIESKKTDITKVSQNGRIVTVATFIPNLAESKIKIRDFKGNSMAEYSIQSKKYGNNSFALTLSDTFSTGYYIISIENQGEVISATKAFLTF